MTALLLTADGRRLLLDPVAAAAASRLKTAARERDISQPEAALGTDILLRASGVDGGSLTPRSRAAIVDVLATLTRFEAVTADDLTCGQTEPPAADAPGQGDKVTREPGPGTSLLDNVVFGIVAGTSAAIVYDILARVFFQCRLP